MTSLALRQIVAGALAQVGVDTSSSIPPKGRPRATTWNPAEPGFGVRHYASGRQVYVIQAHMGGVLRTVTIAPSSVITLHQARTVARQVLAWARVGQDPASERQRLRKVPAFADFLDEYWLRCSPRWKASTLETNGKYRRLYLDTAFPGKFVDEISEADVARWFSLATDRAGPGGANRTFSILKAAFYKAERWGYRPDGTNPCAWIRPNKARQLERHLSSEELARLGAVLNAARKGGDPYRSSCASGILLLLLTGCRCSEVMSALWSDIQGNRLKLRDSKTGPRTVWLGPEARAVIDELPRYRRVDALFWNPRYGKPIRELNAVWHALRSEAGLGHARLHDLRHTFASQATMNAETMPMVAKLLGHARIRSTARYAHHDDAHLFDAVERVGELVVRMLE